MGATFSRIKNWTTEILSNTDLNAEIDNILNNLGPAGVDDYSTSAAQMRLSTDPGESGSESLATSLAGELERLRFVIKEMKGSVTYWYETATTSLSDLSSAVGTGLPDNRIASGITTGNSSQLIVLDPSGSTTSLTFDCAPTAFVYYVDGTQYSVTADVTVTGLSAAPATNNTCLINDSLLSSDQHSMFLGEYGTEIPVDNAGSEIASRVGQYAGFSVVSGGNTEYFVAYINSTNSLTKAWRGCFFNSSQTAVNRIRFSDNETVSLLRLTWVFATTSSSIAVTYTTPTYASSEPSAPSSGDYWFDMTNNTWKTFNSTSWVAANATLVGMSLQTSAACVAARTFDKFVSVSSQNSIELERVSNTTVQAKSHHAHLNVFGSALNYGVRLPTWDITANLEAGLSESANTFYYMYLKENGAPLLSDKQPTDFMGSRFGLYHPTETWRCVGVIQNDGSSNLDNATIYSFIDTSAARDKAPSTPRFGTEYGIGFSTASNTITVKLTDRIGNYPSRMIPTRVPFRHPTATVGTYEYRDVTGQPRITLPVGASLGNGTVASSYVFVYAFDNSGTTDLGVSSVLYDDQKVSSTMQISATAASSLLYTTAALTTRPFTLLGSLLYTVGLNGTYTASPARVNVGRVGYDTTAAVTLNSGGQGEWPATGGAWGDFGTLVIPPGDWTLSGNATSINNGSGAAIYWALGISTTSGNDTTGMAHGTNRVALTMSDSTSGFQSSLMLDGYEVNLSVSTSFILKGFASDVAGGNFEYAAFRMQAFRKPGPRTP